MTAIKLEELSPEARAQLMKEAAEELAKKEQTKRSERKKFKEIVSDEVNTLFGIMHQHVEDMKRAKIEIYNSLQALLASKAEVFEVKGDQKTNTFSTADGMKRITIGYRDISDWDGTETAGIEKVKNYISSLASDKEKGKAANYLQALLKPDRAGKLDPRRIMELQKQAEEMNDTELLDGVNIIMNAYKLVKTAPTLTVEERTDSGKWRNIELNFSDVSVVSEAKDENTKGIAGVE
jgi:hypothetical protein